MDALAILIQEHTPIAPQLALLDLMINQISEKNPAPDELLEK
jgi:hypothetical protein